jgi:hypothetical protein
VSSLPSSVLLRVTQSGLTNLEMQSDSGVLVVLKSILLHGGDALSHRLKRFLRRDNEGAVAHSIYGQTLREQGPRTLRKSSGLDVF